jgi:pimeloyl-ACP methyl ester carboxylesterase
MATFVFVHPAWFGGWCWKKLTPLLRDAGHVVFTPTLTGLGDRTHLASRDVGLETHIQDVASMIEFEDLDDVILVGNSSGGAVITGVADRAGRRIAQLVYLDAFVPVDGQSLFDVIPPDRRPAMEALVAEEGDGWLLPRFSAMPWEQFVPMSWQVTDKDDLAWALERLSPTPFRHFTDPIHLHTPDADAPHRVYIRCRGWPHPGFDRYAERAGSDPAWELRELDTSHLPYITDPEKLADLLNDLTA